MYPGRTKSGHTWFAGFAVVCIASSATAQPLPEQPRPVGLVVNGESTDEVVLVVNRDGHLLVRVIDLPNCGLTGDVHAAAIPVNGQDYVALDRIAGLSASLSTDGTELILSATPSLLAHTAIGLQPVTGQRSPIAPAQFLGYDLALTRSDGKTQLTGLLDASLSGRWGVLETSAYLPGASAAPVRLDSSFRRDFPARHTRLVVGDTISQPGSWPHPVRFLGVQYGTDFTLTPDEITYPIPVLSGSAATPSTIELIAAAQHDTMNVGRGTFAIAMPPTINGAGRITMTIRDQAGIARQISRDVYTSPALLRPGLGAFAVEAGLLRRQYGLSSGAYGPLFAALTLRHALNSWLTAQGHVEAGDGTSEADLGGATVIGHLGEVSVDGAASQANGLSGAQIRVQARRLAQTYSLSVSYELASGNFREVGQGSQRPGGRHELTLAGSLALGRLGGISGSYAKLEDGLGSADPRRLGIASASYSMNLAGGYLGFGCQRIEQYEGGRRSAEWTATLNYTHVLGPHSSVSAIADSTRAALAYARNPGDGAGLGLRTVVGEDHGLSWLEGSFLVRSTVGEFSASVTRRGDANTFQARAQGGILRVGPVVQMVPRLDYGFALVELDGEETTSVLLENRATARQVGRGRVAILTGLQPYVANHVALDPANLTLETSLPQAAQNAVPGWRQAAVVRFGDADHHPALIRLFDRNGGAIPVGSEATWSGGQAPVGYDGDLWLDDYVPGAAVTIAYDRTHCRVHLPRLAAQPDPTHGMILTCEPAIEPEAVS